MKLRIKGIYPGENETHEYTYHNIDAKSVRINYGQLYFSEKENQNENHWLWPVSNIIEMKMDEE